MKLLKNTVTVKKVFCRRCGRILNESLILLKTLMIFITTGWNKKRFMG